MAKKIVLITEGAAVGEYYRRLLYELFENSITVENHSAERDALRELPDADLYLVGATSSAVFSHIISLIAPGKNIVLITLTFRKEQVLPLRAIPAGSKALLVNLSVQMAIETIAELNRLGVTHIELLPAYPGMKDVPEAATAVTPGESRFVPPGVVTVVDIGHRVFTAQTVVEIALKLRDVRFLKSASYQSYVNSLVVPDEGIAMLQQENSRMEYFLEILIGSLDIGIIGVDMDNRIFSANSVAQTIFGISRNNLVHKNFPHILKKIDKKIAIDKQLDKMDKVIVIDDENISMTTIPVVLQGEILGYFVTFQRFTEEKRRQQLKVQLYKRGYTAKYTFQHILGNSPPIRRAKNIALKMARTNSPILLTGESGTGKELFAHAIHNASSRKDMAFVAINCAALPEPLLESELFGYAEGAFTGAKKGGKPGLFEYAHCGTLFLDEIEGMSPGLQVKLLRVLQEQELMRIGDDRVISIDVRIIAASNENLVRLLESGGFRRDLYYRLNALPIPIPPLRERGDDMFLIMDSIQKKRNIRFSLSGQAEDAFRKYSWDGNVRELVNMIEYLQFADKEILCRNDLPEIMLRGPRRAEDAGTPEKDGTLPKTLDAYRKAASGKEESFAMVMELLHEAAGGIGRGGVSSRAKALGVPLSEQQVRGILSALHALGLASLSRGRGGSRLTRSGRTLYAAMRDEPGSF